ncbi:MAG: sulfatase-like hydrolase/transferase [Opitutaceae bacterium]|nr:sulfatase-like hydrolase/transferase [Opitutaceae bacterium]
MPRFLTFVLLLLHFALLAAARAAETRPNFLVILCDDLGYGDIASYGHPHIRTPHLDRLAREGTRFTSAYSAAPVCSPSRVGLLTGRSPNRAGVFDWIPAAAPGATTAESRHLTHLRREEITLPRLLRSAGYATALSGKWHCNAAFNTAAQPQPGDAGFDHWFATQNNAAPSHENPRNFVRNGSPVGPQEGFSCQLVAREMIGWIERQRTDKPAQPFFGFVAFHEPHEPVASPADLVASYRAVARNEDEAQYFANVTNLDRAVGDLLAALDRLGLADNTVVYFSSDNGPETFLRYPAGKRSYGTPGPLRGMKLWTTEAGVRVPGLLRWPGRVKAGHVAADPVSSLDLLPTFTALAGAKVPSDLKLDGTDIRSAFTGGPVRRAQPLFWFYYNAINDQRAALRDGPWKLLARLDGGTLPRFTNINTASAPQVRAAKLTDFSLYRVSDDIGEARDVSATEPAKLRELSAKMETLYREVATTMHVWPDVPVSAAPAAPKKKKQ